MGIIHPWDIKEVVKGWQLSPEELSEKCGHRIGTKTYELAVMALTKRLARDLEADGRPCTVAIVKGCLRVLTDAEASAYNEKAQAQSVRRMVDAHKRQIVVNVGNLTQAELEKHDRRLIASGLRVAALREARAACRKKIHAGSETRRLSE